MIHECILRARDLSASWGHVFELFVLIEVLGKCSELHILDTTFERHLRHRPATHRDNHVCVIFVPRR